MANSPFKVTCTPLGLVVLLKDLDNAELNALWAKYAGALDKKDKPFDINSYKESIVKEFIIDIVDIFKDYEIEEIELAIDFLYERIIEVLPLFKLETLCFNVNLLNAKRNRTPSGSEFNPPTNPLDSLILEDDEKDAGNLITKWGDRDGLRKTEKYLKTKIVGQDHAVDSVMRILKLHASELVSHSSLLLVGPTGTGKTQLSKLLGKRYSNNFFKISCEAYSDKHDKATLTGSPPGYIGSNEKSILAEKAAKSNAWVFLFDEIEKANDKFKDLILGLLDEGAITDSQGKLLDFSKSIFIFTSNQGMSDLKHGRNIGFDREENSYSAQTDKIKESIEKEFKPEFLNRIDEIVYFNELNEDDIKKIASLELQTFPVRRSQQLIQYVVKGGFSKKYGARNIQRFIKNNIGIKIAEAIIDRKIPSKGDLYEVEIIEDNVVVINTVDFDIKLGEKTA